MKAAFYSPYLDSMGGGERYMLTLVEALNKRAWETCLLWDGKSVTKQAKKKFNIDIGDTKYLPNAFSRRDVALQHLYALQRLYSLRKFDLIFFISDGSLPLLFGKRNIVHFQVPFHHVSGQSLINRLKKINIHDFVVNSRFTKQIVDKEFNINSLVIYPPVDIESFSLQKKQNAILYSARFSNLLQQKGHVISIQTFKKLYESGIRNYELWLTGSTEVGTGSLLKQLRAEAQGYPIKFFPDTTFKKLRSLYGKARFFWTAVGYGIDEQKEPEKCEHFGITLVEAMAAGCVPLAIRKGGYKEIIEDNESGLFWNNVHKLVSKTEYLINSKSLIKKLSIAAQNRAKEFSKQKFIDQFTKII